MIGLGQPRPGDWVRNTELVPTNLADHVLCSGLRRGTRGVVVSRSWSHLEVEFDTGYGMVRARVPHRAVRVVRRDGGRDRFHRRTSRLTVVRLAVAAFLLFPVVWWVGAYLWTFRTFDGIVPAFAVAAMDSAADLALGALEHPVQSLVYAGFLAVLGRFAFR